MTNACARKSSSRKPSTYHTAPPAGVRGALRRSPERRLDSSLVDNGRLVLRERQLAGPRVDAHGVALAEFALEHLDRQRIEHSALDRPLQRARAVGRIIALFDDEIL